MNLLVNAAFAGAYERAPGRASLPIDAKLPSSGRAAWTASKDIRSSGSHNLPPLLHGAAFTGLVARLLKPALPLAPAPWPTPCLLQTLLPALLTLANRAYPVAWAPPRALDSVDLQFRGRSRQIP